MNIYVIITLPEYQFVWATSNKEKAMEAISDNNKHGCNVQLLTFDEDGTNIAIDNYNVRSQVLSA